MTTWRRALTDLMAFGFHISSFGVSVANGFLCLPGSSQQDLRLNNKITPLQNSTLDCLRAVRCDSCQNFTSLAWIHIPVLCFGVRPYHPGFLNVLFRRWPLKTVKALETGISLYTGVRSLHGETSAVSKWKAVASLTCIRCFCPSEITCLFKHSDRLYCYLTRCSELRVTRVFITQRVAPYRCWFPQQFARPACRDRHQSEGSCLVLHVKIKRGLWLQKRLRSPKPALCLLDTPIVLPLLFAPHHLISFFLSFFLEEIQWYNYSGFPTRNKQTSLTMTAL